MGRWSQDDNKHLSLRACMKLAQEATMNKVWINIGKEWYTPEEFRMLAEKQVVKYSDGMTTLEAEKVKLKDPRQIIPRMEQRIKEMVEIKESFAKKVNDYYKNQ